jgi:hypothetical protein
VTVPPKGEFPTRENCSPDDPAEFALWAFAALPGSNGGQFIMPIDYFRLVSQRLWDLGFRLVEEPTLEYVPPSANEPNWATSAGRWVEAGSISDEEKIERTMASAVARMGHQQKVEFYKALQAWEAGQPLPTTEAGRVVRNMLDSEPDLLPAALKVLRDLHDAA